MLVVPAVPSAEAVQAEEAAAAYIDFARHMVDRPLTAPEVQALREEVAHTMMRVPQEVLEENVALVQQTNEEMASAPTAAERAWWRNTMRMQAVFNLSAEEQARSALLPILDADDPVLAGDPGSSTLITHRDAAAALALERLRTEGVAGGIPDAQVAQVAAALVERFRQAPAAERRVYALLDAWWATLEQTWPSLGAEERAQVRAALSGEAQLPSGLSQRLVGQDSMVVFFQAPSPYSISKAEAEELAAYAEQFSANAAVIVDSVANYTGITSGLTTSP